jgi:hypothetical protein
MSDAKKHSGVHGKFDLNVSRPAKGGAKQISARHYSGTGNVSHFVMATFPEYKGDKRMLSRALDAVNSIIDQTGKCPDKVTARQAMHLSRVAK